MEAEIQSNWSMQILFPKHIYLIVRTSKQQHKQK